MSHTVSVTETSTTVSVTEDATTVNVSTTSNDFDISITNGGAFTAALNDLTDVDTTGVINGQVLSYNAASATWIPSTGGGGGTPGGSTTQVQYNNAGAFAGDAGLTYNDATDTLTVAGGLVVDTTTLVVDATNNRVGVGTASPTTRFEIISSASNSTPMAIRAADSALIATIIETASGEGRFRVHDTSGAVVGQFSGDVGGRLHVGGSSPDGSAALQADSTARGFLPPRMTTAQKNAISTPAEGLQVFDTDLNALCVYAGTAWVNTYSDDGAGVTTLANIDALDATTEATIESAIDTLANLTSIQGRTVTLADAGADAIFGWDDSANAYVNLTAADARTAIALGATDSVTFRELTLSGYSGTGDVISVAGTMTNTSNGAVIFANFTNTITPASNSLSDFRAINFANYAAGTTGITLDSLEGGHFEGARVSSGQDGLISSVIGGVFWGLVPDSGSPATVLSTTVRGIYGIGSTKPSGTSSISATSITGIAAKPIDSAGYTVTNAYGIQVFNSAASNTITNAIGVDVDGQTRGSTLNAGLRVGLSAGATTNAAIQLSDTTGVVGGGILFGADTTLHRSSANVLTLNGDLVVSDEAYGVGWNGSLEVPTKNAIYDKIETLSGGVSDGDKGDITVTGGVWNIDAATVGPTELSATGTPSASTFLRGDNTWATPAGSGDVSKVGTPVNNQMAVWTGDGTLEGTSDFTYDGTSLNLITGKNFQIAGGTVLADSAGTLTLSGIDALDATTEATIEAAIDTLANLTSIQGRTITLADAGADAFLAWDDSANAYQNISQADARTILGLGTAAYVATDLADLNEATIEAAIDTLANLTSIQGRTVTLADAGANAIFGWDDTAGAYENLTQAEVRTIIGNTSDTNVGLVELATTAETNTGTDATRAVTPDGLAGSVFGEKSVCISSFPAGTNTATGNGTTSFVVPASMNGMNLVAAVAAVDTTGTTGTTTIMIRRRRGTTNADMLTVALTIDSTEADSTTAATGITIDAANDDIQTGDKIYIDVDAVHTTPAQGLSTTLTFRLP